VAPEQTPAKPQGHDVAWPRFEASLVFKVTAHPPEQHSVANNFLRVCRLKPAGGQTLARKPPDFCGFSVTRWQALDFRRSGGNYMVSGYFSLLSCVALFRLLRHFSGRLWSSCENDALRSGFRWELSRVRNRFFDNRSISVGRDSFPARQACARERGKDPQCINTTEVGKARKPPFGLRIWLLRLIL